MNRSRSCLTLLLGLALLGPSLTVTAQVRDDGNFFSPQAETELAQAISRIQSRTGKKVVVETYAAVPAELRSGVSRPNFWEDWIISRGRENDAAVIIVVCRDPRHVEVGSSKGMRASGAFAASDHQAVTQGIAPYFKAGEFDAGILRGLQLIEARLGGAVGSAAPPTRDRPAGNASPGGGGFPQGSAGGTSTPPAGSGGGSGGMGMGTLLCVGVAVIGLFVLLKGVLGGRRQQQSPYGNPYDAGAAGNNPPPLPPGGYGGGGAGGGFGRGVGGGILGGLLGGWLANRAFGQGQQHDASASSADNNFTPPVDPGPASSGFDFGGGDTYGGVEPSDSGGGGFDSGGGGGGDASSGSDF